MNDTRLYKKLVARQFSRNFREATPEVMSLIVSALTASVGLRIVGQMKAGQADEKE